VCDRDEGNMHVCRGRHAARKARVYDAQLV
jgi:hypothetical protein